MQDKTMIKISLVLVILGLPLLAGLSFIYAPEQDNVVATFDAAGLVGFPQIRDAVLAVKPFLFPDKDTDDGQPDNADDAGGHS